MVSRTHVIAGYKTILQRNPESEQAIEDHIGIETVDDLLRTLVTSREFKDRYFAGLERPSALTLDHLDDAAADFQRGDRDIWRGKSLVLPEWFDLELDPDGSEFRDQMLKLWSAITGRSTYDPETNEDTPEIGDLDPVKRPGFYGSADSHFAGGQLMAMGHIIMRSGVSPGDRVLEYGAGYAQTAVALARLGVKVDTVDINPAFCRAVQANADLFDIDLTPHCGPFGINPAGEPASYDVILFYESFHHCLDFETLIPRLKTYLKANGRIILAGEPIFDGPCKDMPYAWGFRLDWENVAVMRIRGWMELGFQRDFLLRKFGDAGFDCTIHTDPNSHWAQVYEFRQSATKP